MAGSPSTNSRHEAITPVRDPVDRESRIVAVIQALERRFGPRAAFRLRERSELLAQRGGLAGGWAVSTGSIGLDRATGANGVPRGQLTELFGPVGSGKAMLSYHLLAAGQREGGLAALVDGASTTDDQVLSECGVDLADLLLASPASGREALLTIDLLLESRALDVLVLSRLDLLGLGVGALGAAFGRIQLALKGAPTALVVTSEARGLSDGRPLGRAIAHYASLRIRLDPIRTLSLPGGAIGGVRIRATVAKTRLGTPDKSVDLDLRLGSGIDQPAELLALARDAGLITYNLAGYQFAGWNLGLGERRARDTIAANPDLSKRLADALRAREATSASRDANSAEGAAPRLPKGMLGERTATVDGFQHRMAI